MRDYQKITFDQSQIVNFPVDIGKTGTGESFNLAQLRHAWHHLDQGRVVAGKEVLASVIRSMESRLS